MEPFFKYLPVKGEISTGDYRIENGHIYYTPDGETAYNCRIEQKEKHNHDLRKVFLFICTRDIKEGDRAYNDSHGLGWSVYEFGDPHIILDLHHSDYKPYEVMTSHGFGPKEHYFKIIRRATKEEQEKYWDNERILSNQRRETDHSIEEY